VTIKHTQLSPKSQGAVEKWENFGLSLLIVETVDRLHDLISPHDVSDFVQFDCSYNQTEGQDDRLNNGEPLIDLHFEILPLRS
jgi:hypothetical protein